MIFTTVILKAIWFKDAQDGEIQESDYFYASFDEMYQTMKSDYTKATGLEWEGY